MGLKAVTIWYPIQESQESFEAFTLQSFGENWTLTSLNLQKFFAILKYCLEVLAVLDFELFSLLRSEFSFADVSNLL